MNRVLKCASILNFMQKRRNDLLAASISCLVQEGSEMDVLRDDDSSIDETTVAMKCLIEFHTLFHIAERFDLFSDSGTPTLPLTEQSTSLTKPLTRMSIA